jgi:2-polyprenyl-3-methyl-5-hydroxy-6-metoxy-1,4-benzoquinol methylase/thioredoxin-like negative regulator of GroEL
MLLVLYLLKIFYIKQAIRLCASGDFFGAEKVLEKVMARKADVDVLIRYAKLATARKDWGSAVDRWERVIFTCDSARQAIPKAAVVQLEKARLAQAGELRKAGDLDESLRVLSALLVANPKHYAAQIEMAEIHADKNEYEKSLAFYLTLLEIDRRRLKRVLQGMAATFKACGKPENAQSVAKGAALCGLADSSWVDGLLQGYANEEKWGAATEVLLNVAAINPLAIANAQTARLTVNAFKKTDQTKNASMMLYEAISVGKKQKVPFKSLAILKEIERSLQGNSDESMDVSRKYYDDVYETSMKYKSHGNESVYLPVWKEVVDQIKSGGYHQVLDLGCGPGQFAEYLLEQIPHLKYTGIDFSTVAIAAAQKRCPHAQFIQADLFAENIFDDVDHNVVLLLEVLEHLHQDLELLKKLPPGSRIIASVPNFDSFGHVRYFISSTDVAKRYECVMKIDLLKPVSVGEKSIIFIIYGVVR